MKTVSTIAGEFNKARYDRLREAYKDVLNLGAQPHNEFMFENKAMVVGFAKYLLEFLEPHFKDIK